MTRTSQRLGWAAVVPGGLVASTDAPCTGLPCRARLALPA
jgi:hypothetical protein